MYTLHNDFSEIQISVHLFTLVSINLMVQERQQEKGVLWSGLTQP